MNAVERGEGEMACLLIDAGADICAVDTVGETSLHRALRRNDAAMSAILVERGASLYCRNHVGEVACKLKSVCVCVY